MFSPSNKEIADVLGVTPPRASDFLNRKTNPCPRDLGLCLAWFRNNIKPRKKRKKDRPATKTKLAPLAAATSEADYSWQASVERLKRAEFSCAASLQRAIEAGDTSEIDRHVTSHAKVSKERRETERLAAEAAVETGDIITRAEVKEIFGEFLRRYREALDKLPLAERTNCNPQRPEIAERALTEWRDKQIQAAAKQKNKF